MEAGGWEVVSVLTIIIVPFVRVLRTFTHSIVPCFEISWSSWSKVSWRRAAFRTLALASSGTGENFIVNCIDTGILEWLFVLCGYGCWLLPGALVIVTNPITFLGGKCSVSSILGQLHGTLTVLNILTFAFPYDVLLPYLTYLLLHSLIMHILNILGWYFVTLYRLAIAPIIQSFYVLITS